RCDLVYALRLAIDRVHCAVLAVVRPPRSPAGHAQVHAASAHLVDRAARQIDRRQARTGRAYYVKTGAVYAVDLKTKVVDEIATLPARGSIATVNADETLLAGTITEGAVPGTSEARGRDSYPGKGDMMERRLAARLPMQ